MHFLQIDYIVAVAAIVSVLMCGMTRAQSLLWGLWLQNMCLALAAGTLAWAHGSSHTVLLTGALLLKTFGIPSLLAWSTNKLAIPRDPGYFLPASLSLFAGFGLLIACLLISPELAVPGQELPLAAGVSLALLVIGMLLMTTKRLAVNQVIAFLTLENGILLFGMTQSKGMPILVEMGVVFEVLVGVMIAGLVISKLNRSFEHIDVTRMRELRH